MLKALTRIEHWLDSICNFMALMSGIIAVLAVILVCVEVISRYSGVGRIAIANEYSGYALVFIVFVAAANAVKTGIFVRVRFFISWLPRRVQGITNIFALVLGSIVVGVFSWRVVALFAQSLKLGATSLYATYTPIAIPQGFIIAGLFMLELMLIRLTIKASLDFMAGAVPEIGETD
ncbi:unnamed protein product [marine sediment metagenome]|uniref:Tripartite ATP-independent periplasmic transporters DctQ component domain-containing protein n=1 Tax=marine sediment metagenome TaxID=412755 RepID=X1UAY1_9ZZZZ